MAGSQALVADVLKLCCMSLGLAYFVVLVSIDLWRSLKNMPRTRWIPAKALILSALTIQVLTYLDYNSVSISDKPDAEEYAMLLGNQSVIDSGRLVICVFIGYMLPGMANRGSAAQSSDIAALGISLFTAITSELYYIHKVNKTVIKVEYGYVYEFYSENPAYFKEWFVVSSLVVLVCTVMLVLFLVAAILASKPVRCMLAKRIPPRLEQSNRDGFEDKIVRSWFLCRVGQPQYVIARSVLSSSIGLVVTVCIVFLVVKGIVLKSGNIIHHNDGWDWLRHITFGLQCIFVLLGWTVIMMRWLFAVFYFSTFSFSKFCGGNVCQRCYVEDFWTRSICEIIHMYEIHPWRLQLSHRKCMAIVFWFVAKLYKLLYLVLGLQKCLVFFSKCCWFVSEIIFWVFKFFKKSEPERENYEKYKKELELLCMPGEDPKNLWLANERTFHKAQYHFRSGFEAGSSHDKLKSDLEAGSASKILCECEDLKTLLTNHYQRSDNAPRFVDQLKHLQLVKDYFPALIENCWKITAVSLIKIIKKVLSPNKAEPCIKAYKQAWDLLTFAESSSVEQPNTINVLEVFDIEFDPISMAADRELKMMEYSETPTSDAKTSKEEEDERATIQKLLDEAKQKLQAQKMLPTEQNPQKNDAKLRNSKDWNDSKDWNVIAPSYNMYIVCNLILNASNVSGSPLVDKLQDFLGEVICDGLEKLRNALEKICSDWAVEFEEEKIWEAIYFAGKLEALLHEQQCCTAVEAQV